MLDVCRANIRFDCEKSYFISSYELDINDSLFIKITPNISDFGFPNDFELIRKLKCQKQLYSWLLSNNARDFIFGIDIKMNPIIEIHTASEDKIFIMKLEEKKHRWIYGFIFNNRENLYTYPIET